jgi:adenylosuccinate lyase
VEEPFEEGQTGSSAMPHKRNPELCERICGLARLVRGYVVTAIENISLWHERDISHSSAERVILPDSCLVVDYVLDIFTSIIKNLRIFPKRMEQNLKATKGLIFSQRVMLALIDKGVSRQQAYKITQRNAMKSWNGNKDFLKLLSFDSEVTDLIPIEEIEALFDYKHYLRHVDEIFKRLGLTNLQWKKKLSNGQGGTALIPRAI